MEPRTPDEPTPGEPTPGEPMPQADGVDLLTVALLVFFVSLIAIVGLMLFLPALV